MLAHMGPVGASDPSSVATIPRSSAARRLRRLGLCVLAYVIALGGLRWWWGCEADRRLTAKIDEYRRAGQPVLPEDFQVAPVPDEENAVLLYGQAISKLASPARGQPDFSDFLGDPTLIEEKRDALVALLEQNVEPLRLLREARGKPGVDWKTRPASPLVFVPLPQLSGARGLAKAASVAAWHEYTRGNNSDSLERVRDTLALGAATERVHPCLITHLVRIAIDALAGSVVERIAPALRTSDAATPTQPAVAPAQPAQVRALIAELLDEESLRADWRLALYGERLFILDTMECLANGRFTPAAVFGTAGGVPGAPWMAPVFGPAWKLDTARALERFTAYVEAATAEDWPSARRLLPVPAEPIASSGLWALVTTLSSIVMPSMERAVQLHFRALALRRMAATALAIRLYEVDHGRRPATLAELVPDYLAAVPRDPYAADGRALGYRPDASPPVLYSVGPDGVDNAGQYALRAGGEMNYDEMDQPFFLDGRRPRPRLRWLADGTPRSAPAESAPSTQAVDDDKHIKEAQGDAQGHEGEHQPGREEYQPAP